MASINLSEFIEVQFVDVAMVQMGVPTIYKPTLVFRDDMDRAIAIPIGQEFNASQRPKMFTAKT